MNHELVRFFISYAIVAQNRDSVTGALVRGI
jgi:hypothetical protein